MCEIAVNHGKHECNFNPCFRCSFGHLFIDYNGRIHVGFFMHVLKFTLNVVLNLLYHDTNING